MTDREPGRVQSVCKAMELLSCLAQARTPLTLGELSRQTGMPKATVHGLLSALRSSAVVEQSGEDGRYRLGIRLFEYGCAVSRGWNVLEAAAEPMRHIAEETGETASIAALDRGDVLILDSADARSNFRVVSEKGSRLPVHCTSQGKLFLAYCSSEAEQARLLRAHPPVPHTPHTITDPDQLAQELRKIQAQGYAVEDGEFRIGLRSVSAPIFGLGGTLQYALGVVGLFRRTTTPEFTLAIRLATEYAAQISDELETLSGRP